MGEQVQACGRFLGRAPSSGSEPGGNPAIDIFRRNRRAARAQIHLRRRDNISGIQMFRDAETGCPVVLRIPAGCEPDIASQNRRIHRAILRIVNIGKGADPFLVFKQCNAGKRLWLAAHAEAGNDGLRTGAAKRFRRGPFNKRVGEDKSAVSAEKEIDRKVPQTLLPGKLRRPPARPVFLPECRDRLISGSHVLRNTIQLNEKTVTERFENRVAQAGGGRNRGRSKRIPQPGIRLDEP